MADPAIHPEGELPGAAREMVSRVESDGGVVLAAYREPVGGHWQMFCLLPIEAVSPTPYQRDLSPTHAKRLQEVIRKLDRAVAALKKRGIRHPFVKNYVLARTTPLTRQRKTLPSFDQTFTKLLANIEAFDVTKVRYEDLQRASLMVAPPSAE